MCRPESRDSMNAANLLILIPSTKQISIGRFLDPLKRQAIHEKILSLEALLQVVPL